MKIFIITFLCLLTQLYSIGFSQTGAVNSELIAGYTQNISPYYKVTIQPAGAFSGLCGQNFLHLPISTNALQSAGYAYFFCRMKSSFALRKDVERSFPARTYS